MTRLILWILLTLGLIALEYRRRREWKRTLLATAAFVWILGLGFSGMIMRPVLPFFVAHILALILAWGALLYYLYSRRLLWWALLFPLATLGLFVLFDFLEGSRYEA
jgi:hydrogenase/urease accessory protein HupE